jgi:transposase
MRSGFDRRSEVVKSELSISPLSGGIFVFVSWCRKRVKLLYWDRDGYALWYKRLEAGAFRVEKESGYETITGVDLKALLSGVELSRIRMQKVAAAGSYA